MVTGSEWKMTSKDVLALKAMEEECNWAKKQSNGASVYKSSRDIIQTIPPEKFSQADNPNIDQSGLEIGDDGHYYVCLVCGLGGYLLCCNYGPCTYHIKCLNPPLQSIPEGKWKCPVCSTGCSSKRVDTESVNRDMMAVEGLMSLSDNTSTSTKKKSSRKAPDASPGKFSTGYERGRQRKHNTSKRQKYSRAGQARKEK